MAKDEKALAQYLEVHNWIADRWPAAAMDTIRENNRPMYDRMSLLADKIDEQLAIENKTKQQQKQFAELLAAFRRIHELGIIYVTRRSGVLVEA